MLNIFSGVLTSLLVPKILGVEEFGYWQLFVFYTSYGMVFSLGVGDGVYLIEGGRSRDTINKRSIKSQFLLGMSYQLAIALLICLLAASDAFGADRSFVLFSTAVFFVLNNAANYFSYLLQAINETRKSSMSVAINSATFIVPLVVLIAMRVPDYRVYIVFYALSRLISLIYCMVVTRDFLSAPLLPLGKSLPRLTRSIRAGSKLMFATLASSLILGVMRFLIDLNWGIEQFSIVSLSVSMTTLVLTCVSQASMVLFPTLRQVGEEALARCFELVRDCLDFLLPVVYLLYSPGAFLLSLWLPQYETSFHLFSILLPLCVFDGKMDLVGMTFLKVQREERRLLKINVATLAVGAAFSLVGTYALHSIEFILGGTVVAVMVRCLYSEHYVAKMLGVRASQLAWGVILISTLFSVSAYLLGYMASWIISVVLYGTYLVLNRSRLHQTLSSLGFAHSA
ncbi:hypothetical protein H9X80_04565 [Olsenella profusa]|uniref:Polysaccharide biosynthesis protein n=2 Tax=Olsenella profusa TaxID=138595 RepID=A0ABS2F1G1_9ACTN|nr:hypothetical protein [Olsenella profusa]